MKATERKKVEIAKDIARKLEKIVDKPYPMQDKLAWTHEDMYLEVPRGTLKELCRIVRRMKIEEADNT